MTSLEEQVTQSLERLFIHSTQGKHPTASRFLTLKAMLSLGNRWESPGEIMRELQKYKIHTNYVYEIVGRLPLLIETDTDKSKVKIRDEVYPILMRLIGDYIVRIQELISGGKK